MVKNKLDLQNLQTENDRQKHHEASLKREETASKRRVDYLNRSVQNLTLTKRGETPSSIRRPTSRGGVSKATSYTNYSRLSLNSEGRPRRRDSFDDIANYLNEIEHKLESSKCSLSTD